MKLEGEIWELQLVPRLIELGSEGFTGALRFENDSVIKIVYFKEGNILSASTNDRADSIDEILLRSGKVTREHVKQALSKRKETETLGDALLGLGFIAKRELAWARRVQLIGILRSVGEWQSGTFTIVSDYLPKREEGTAFPLPQIVLELILTDQDRSKYDRALESGAVVFRKSSAFEGSFAAMGLNQEAETITSRIDGVRSAAEIASESGSDAFNVYKLLNALNLLGLVEKSENSLEVSVAPVPDATSDFAFPAEPTVEMSVDFGRSAPAFDAGDDFAAPQPVADDFEVPRLDTDSSVPPEDLDSYEYTAPVADVSADLGLGLGAAKAEAEPERTNLPPPPSTHEGLGSIEALRNFDVPASEFPPIEDRIAKKHEAKKPLTGPPARGGRKTGLIAAVALGVLAVVAAAGWFFLQSRQAEETVAQTETRPTPPKPAQRPSPGTDTAQVTTTVGDGSSTAAPGVQETAATATSAPATTATVAPPFKPIMVGTTTRTPEPKPVVPPPPPTTQVKPPASTPSAPASGKYAAQANQYAREASSVPFTVQFALVCRDSSVENTIRVGGAKIWFVPISYRGEACYRVFWGRYSTREQAERGATEIPASLRGGKPSVVSPGAATR